MKEAAYDSPLSGHIWHTKIIACGHAPRCVHNLGGSRKELLSEVPGSLAQDFIEFDGSQGRDRHTLTINGIEAAIASPSTKKPSGNRLMCSYRLRTLAGKRAA